MAWSQTRRRFVVACALVLAAHATSVAWQDDVRIHGRVVTESGAPVRGATVVLTHLTNRTWTVSTDDDGAFDARGLPSGSYSVRVSKAGFMMYPPQAYASGLSPGLAKKGETKEMRIVMRRGSAIAGRIVDAFGDPVIGAIVAANRVTFSPPGTRSLSAIKTETTNDLGAYRIFGLEPGTYYVSAFSKVASTMPMMQEGVMVIRADPTASSAFYPSGRQESEAQPIRLGAGEDRLGVDITLIQFPLSRVTGRVITSAGVPAREAIVMFTPRGIGGSVNRNARTDSSGFFSVADLAHGDYVMFAGTREYLELVGQQGTTNPAGAFESGMTSVSVTGEVSGIELQLSRGFDIGGRVLIDGAPPVIKPNQRLDIITDADVHSGPRFTRVAAVRPGGDFIVTGSPAGRIRLSALGLPDGAMISRILLNGFDVTDDGFEVMAPVTGIEIIVTTTPPVVSGTVTDAAGKPTFGGVMVFSENSRLWTLPNTRYLKATGTSIKSEYSIKGLPPGRYLAVAIGMVDQLTWADPLNLDELRKVATPFTMPESGTVTVNLVRR